MVAESASHTWELLSVAARGLACGTGTLAGRLRYAFTDGLIWFRDATTPWPDVTNDLRDVMDYFAHDPKTGLLIVEGLSEDDQRRIAGEIFDLYVKVSKLDR
jgi:hypothetical protein